MVLIKFPCLLVATVALLGVAPPQITTSQYNNSRTGANAAESILSPQNVNGRQFGKIGSFPVDGDVYAQPLYLPNVGVPGKGVHNILFVATEHDSVYAFDADQSSPLLLWHANLLPSGKPAAPVPAVDVQCPFISPEIGITSTPVIDIGTGTLYVLTKVKIWTNGRSDFRYVQQIHALAITTGVEKFGGPVQIRASVVGTGAGSSRGEVSFDALRENPRSALLLANGTVYLSWASSCDVGPYHGWVMAYDARTLRQQAVFNTSPDSAESGIWLSDTGPAADRSGKIYVVTGNGQFDANEGGRDYGDTVLKLRLHGDRFDIEGYFTPFNQQKLNSTDGDLGSGGPLLLPERSNGDPAGLVFGGKAGVMYVVNPEHMGGLQIRTDTNAKKVRLSSGIFSAPAYWNGHLYYYASDDGLKEFVFQNGRLSSEPSNRSREKSPFSGGTPTVSARGNASGVVWIVETRAWNRGGTPAVLRAYEALNVQRQLYSSAENPTRDGAGEALRFSIPTVANGRVYFGVKKAVEVYGLLSK